MKTIYNTYVVIESQEQCDRMKQLCIDNKLIYDNVTIISYFREFFFYNSTEKFGVLYGAEKDENKTQVTEQEFIKLLKNTKL